MNTHLRTSVNRDLLYGVVQDLKLDIIAVTETWFEVNTSNKLVGNVFGDDFVWFGKERVKQTSPRGEGGVGVLVRKGWGNCSGQGV